MDEIADEEYVRQHIKPGPIKDPKIIAYLNKKAEEKRKWMAEYHKQHEVCPKCFSKKITSTCMGFFGNEDHNHAYCSSCEWSGRVYEMVPTKEMEK